MFNSPKRHHYHDFPFSLAKEYLTEINYSTISKSWSRRQVYYQDYDRLTVLHDAYDWECDNHTIFEFTKIWGDPTDKKRNLAGDLTSPLMLAIGYKKDFDFICNVVETGGRLNNAQNWISVTRNPGFSETRYEKKFGLYFSTTNFAAQHPDLKVIAKMHELGIKFDYRDLYFCLKGGTPEVFEFLIHQTSATFDWMAVIKNVFETDIFSEKLFKENMEKKLKLLTKETPPTEFHHSFLIEKMIEFNKDVEYFELFKSGGFEMLTNQYVKSKLEEIRKKSEEGLSDKVDKLLLQLK